MSEAGTSGTRYQVTFKEDYRGSHDLTFLQRHVITHITGWGGLSVRPHAKCVELTLDPNYDTEEKRGAWLDMFREKTTYAEITPMAAA